MIRQFADAATAAQACAEDTAQLLARLTVDRAVASMAVSGGSTPRMMFQALIRLPVDWKRVHVFWVDERGVPPNDSQSNYRMTAENLLHAIEIPAQNVHRIHAELEPAEAARLYEEELRGFFGGPPVFDLIHMGVGADGHTASLFPGSDLVRNEQDDVAAAYVVKMSQWRITLLPSVLRRARHCFVLATGADKREALQAVLKGPVDPVAYPAQLVLRARDYTLFTDLAGFTDQAAV